MTGGLAARQNEFAGALALPQTTLFDSGTASCEPEKEGCIIEPRFVLSLILTVLYMCRERVGRVVFWE